jgi:hypothetical protein
LLVPIFFLQTYLVTLLVGKVPLSEKNANWQRDKTRKNQQIQNYINIKYKYKIDSLTRWKKIKQPTNILPNFIIDFAREKKVFQLIDLLLIN